MRHVARRGGWSWQRWMWCLPWLVALLLAGGCATPADQGAIPWGAPQEGEGFTPGEGGMMGMPMVY